MDNVNKQTPELSVVIPAYNAEKFIGRTLTSLENQTVSHQRYEVIVVDDGSKDNTLQLCKEFALKYPNIIVVHQENGGVSAARNAGIEAATGTWLSFVDSDDHVQEHYVETLLGASDEAQYVVFDNYLEQDGKRSLEKEWMQPWFDTAADKETVLEWICDHRLNAPWDKRFSLELVKKHNIRFPLGLHMGEDMLFNLAYALRTETIFVSGKAVYIHEDNLEGLCNQRITLKRLQDHERVYEGMLQLCREGQLPDKFEAIIHKTMLRVIAGYAGKLHKAGLTKREIAEAFCNSELVRAVLAAPTQSRKGAVRKLLLKQKWYGLCAKLFK